MSATPIVLVGSGGCGREVLWLLDDLVAAGAGWQCLGFIDPAHPERRGDIVFGRPILGGWEAAASLPAGVSFVNAIGAPPARERESAAAVALGWRPATLLHPTVLRAPDARVGEGAVIGPQCVLGPNAAVGRHCYLNVGVGVGHDARVGDYCNLCPGVRICGNAVIGEASFVGTNAVVGPGARLGRACTLAAASLAAGELGDGVRAIGVPAVPLRRNSAATA